MKSFLEMIELMEAGMGFIKAKCMRCDKEQTVSKFAWNSGKAKCKNCGGGLEELEEKKNDSN